MCYVSYFNLFLFSGFSGHLKFYSKLFHLFRGVSPESLVLQGTDKDERRKYGSELRKNNKKKVAKNIFEWDFLEKHWNILSSPNILVFPSFVSLVIQLESCEFKSWLNLEHDVCKKNPVEIRTFKPEINCIFSQVLNFSAPYWKKE